MDKKLSITEEAVGERLDLFLAMHLPNISRSQIQKLVKEGGIMVNGKVVPPHRFLKKGDSVIVASLGKIEHRKSNIENDNPPTIIAETPEYIVIEKPVGMVTHPGVKKEGDTVVDWILEHYPEVRGVGDDPLRPGIVHRLDKDASGVMVVARTQESYESLIRQFKLRQIKKEYRVVAYGRVIPKEGVIDFPIGRSTAQYTKRAAGSKEGQPALTRYVVEEYRKYCSLVRVSPETGRTHQIRVHFFAKGNPIVGDTLYVSKKIKPIPATRLMLHAELLRFRDLSGEWQEYRAELPSEFAHC